MDLDCYGITVWDFVLSGHLNSKETALKRFIALNKFIPVIHIFKPYLPVARYPLDVWLSRYPPLSVHIHKVYACVWWQREGEREREPGKEQTDCGLHAQWRGDDVEPWRKCSASAPVKLRLSFTTGCSRPSFQTAIHPLLFHPSLPSHSLALRYGLWHQARVFAISHTVTVASLLSGYPLLL